MPSASIKVAPLPLSIKIGIAPTAFHARTGEFTAPGILTLARLKSSSDFLRDVIAILLKIRSDQKQFFDREEKFDCTRQNRTELRRDAKN
ncbi:hypothetical protein [Candidatus Binatus sp.]|uniref:hypothetical protein n=1 Tax=Candidatus Binatus sp. TaxID=2811406 RepID=UPI002F929DB3